MAHSLGKIRLMLAALAVGVPAIAIAGSHAITSSSTDFDDLEWTPMAEGVPVDLSVLWGNLETGPVGFLIRVAPGFAAPMHSHSANYRAVVVSGRHKHWIEGEDPEAMDLLGPGSVFVQAADQLHGDANVTDEPVVSFVYFDGPFDMIVPE